MTATLSHILLFHRLHSQSVAVSRQHLLCAVRKFLSGLIVIALLSPTFPALADEHCTPDACVDVSTNPTTGKITIHVRKGRPASSSSPRPSPRPRPTPRPTPRPPPRPTHRAAIPRRPTPHLTPHPQRKRALPHPTPSESPAISLSDQLTQLIPDSQIGVSPTTGVVTNIPTYFSTNAPALFATQSVLLGIAVGISLMPVYTWDFGDSQTEVRYTPDPIAHTYRSTGFVTAKLTISWSGTWSTNGFSYQVLGGAIVQSYSITLNVHQGPTPYEQ